MTPTMRSRDLDEDDVRIRPTRSSRPRSRQRPTHADAQPAFVVAVDRGRYVCRIDDGTASSRDVVAVRARELGRKAVVVGDDVAVVGDTTGGPDALARIVRVGERRSVLRRTADDNDPVERVIVANADQLAIVTATANPEPRRRLVDRCLVAAFDAGLEPILVVTKIDLAPPDELLALLDPLDVQSVTVRRGGDLDPLRAALGDRVTVLVGHSGVGKSTLVNALVPSAHRTTGGVNIVTGRGRHTSSSAIGLELPGGGWVIDTPGVRSFGLAHVKPANILHAFADLDEAAAACPRGCTHLADAPDCALDEAVTEGTITTERLDSFRRLLTARGASEDAPG